MTKQSQSFQLSEVVKHIEAQMSQVNLSFRDKNMRYSLETATMQLKVIASADGNSVQIPTQAEELKQLKLSILHLEFSPLETHKAKVFLETP